MAADVFRYLRFTSGLAALVAPRGLVGRRLWEMQIRWARRRGLNELWWVFVWVGACFLGAWNGHPFHALLYAMFTHMLWGFSGLFLLSDLRRSGMSDDLLTLPSGATSQWGVILRRLILLWAIAVFSTLLVHGVVTLVAHPYKLSRWMSTFTGLGPRYPFWTTFGRQGLLLLLGLLSTTAVYWWLVLRSRWTWLGVIFLMLCWAWLSSYANRYGRGWQGIRHSVVYALLLHGAVLANLVGLRHLRDGISRRLRPR